MRSGKSSSAQGGRRKENAAVGDGLDEEGWCGRDDEVGTGAGQGLDLHEVALGALASGGEISTSPGERLPALRRTRCWVPDRGPVMESVEAAVRCLVVLGRKSK